MKTLKYPILALFILSAFMLVILDKADAADADCAACHNSYNQSVNSSLHNQTLSNNSVLRNQTLNVNVPSCTDCHIGYNAIANHTTGTKGMIVNKTTCKTCHINGTVSFMERHSSSSDCTQCHFANTTQRFSLNNSLFTHDHNLTVEHNFYDYNISGMPLTSNSGVGIGMFPYYTCTQASCHTHSNLKIENATSGWFLSKHARSRVGTSDSKNSCAKCKSPPNFDGNSSNSTTIAAADWQGIQCRVCHNIHNRKVSTSIGGEPLAYYNSTSSSQAGYPVYEAVANATVLCENCHTGTSHDSKYAGVHKDIVGFDCADCHANGTYSNYNHTFEVKNTTSGVTGCEVCHETADHTWEQTSKHTDVECWACHDQLVSLNTTSGNATSSDNNYGIWKNPTTSNWSTYKLSHGAPAEWVLHNISKTVNCDKCHVAKASYNGTIGPNLTCDDCHTSYGSAVNLSRHNQTLNGSAPNCTLCHTGYQPRYGHTVGTKGYTVNETNTCKNSGCHNSLLESHGNKHYGQNKADCTQCHFANTTQRFNWNNSLFTHDHNLTVEYNFYNYNLSGMPLSTNGGVGKGMFPYYTCTNTCHSRYKIEDEVIGWNESAHARSLHNSGDNKNSCAKCKSPPNFDGNSSNSATITAADWQGIQCRVCHNLHNDTYSGNGTTPIYYAFYNSTATGNGTPVYEKVPNATVLCENCHTGSSHDSKYAGVHKDTVGFDCASCHMNSTFSNRTHKFEVKNTTSGVTGCEVCHETADHTWPLTSYHTDNVTCEACHDQTFVVNATNFSVTNNGTGNYNNGLHKNLTTNKWTIYKISHGAPADWPLHNISKSVNCTKCHNASSPWDGTTRRDTLIAPAFSACTDCHSSYGSAVNSTKHNQTRNASAPNCTDCHTGYQINYGHTSGTKGFVVNESNTCTVSCHINGTARLTERHSSSSDCTKCHFANTTQRFGLNNSLFTHDHNLTVEHNFYDYNISGMPIKSNSGAGIGMFPYYTCTLTCHATDHGVDRQKIDDAASGWFQSGHARSRHGGSSNDSWNNCAKCKSPPNYNDSLKTLNPSIAEADWQGIQCRVCHNIHNRKVSTSIGGEPLAYYNSTSSSQAGYPVYEAVANATVLCEKCHTGSSHDSKYAGYHKDTLAFTCADCHANSTISNRTHKFEVKNTTSGVEGCEVCHETADHTWSFTSLHINNVTCEACHDQTFVVNATNFSVTNTGTANYNNGLYKNTTTNKWTIYKISHSAPADWPLHNISRSVNCSKCHNAYSPWNGTTRQDTLIASNISTISDCMGCHDTGGIAPYTVSFSSLNSSNSVHRTLNLNTSTPSSSNNSRCWGCHGDGNGSESAQPVNDHPSNYNTPKNCNNNSCHAVSQSKYNETMVYSHFHNSSLNDNPNNDTNYNITTTEPCENCHVNSLVTTASYSNLALVSHYGSKDNLFDSMNCTYCHLNKDNSEKWGNATLINKNRTGLVLLDKEHNKFTLFEGETMYLGEGYSLKLVEVSLRREEAFIQLSKDNNIVDSDTLQVGSSYKYEIKVGIDNNATMKITAINLNITSIHKTLNGGFIQFEGSRLRRVHTDKESNNTACYACHLNRYSDEKQRYIVLDKELKDPDDIIYYTKVLLDFNSTNKSIVYFNDEDDILDQINTDFGKHLSYNSKKKFLAEGETWRIADDLSLKLNEASTDSKLAWLTLTVNNVTVKNEVASIGSEFIYTPGISYKESGGKTDVTIFTANITSIFQGNPNFIMLKDVVAISPNIENTTVNTTLFGYNSSWFKLNDTFTIGRIPTNLHVPGLRDDIRSWGDCVLCHDSSKKLGIPSIDAISSGLGKHSIVNMGTSNTISLTSPVDKACWACHSNGIEPQTHIPTYTTPRTCQSCHVNQKEPFYGAVNISDEPHALFSSCETCHTPESHIIIKPAGAPMISEAVLSQSSVKKGETVKLTAKASGGLGMKVKSAEYFIDTKGSSGKGMPLKPVDGIFNSQTEQVTGDVSTNDISAGEHIIYIHAMERNNRWGEFNQVNFSISGGGNSSVSKALESARAFLKSIPGLDMIYILLSLVAAYFIIVGISRRR